MLINLNKESGTALLDLLNTEDAFGTLNKSLKKVMNEIKEGLLNYEGH